MFPDPTKNIHTNIPHILDLSLLWKTVWDVFPYFDRITDWDPIYEEFLPKAAAAAAGKEIAMVYAEFMARLGDGHTMFDFPRSLTDHAGALPFELLYTKDGYLISSCPDHWKKHLYAPILSLNGRPFSQWLEEIFRYSYHVEDYVPGWRLKKVLPLLLPEHNELETATGKITFSLHDRPVPMLTAPTLSVSLPYQKTDETKLDIRLYDGSILYAAMPDCQYPKTADEIAAAIQKTSPKGMILDLRDNIGGMTKCGGQVAELLISGQFHGCRKRTRISKGIDMACGSQFALMSEEELAGLSDQEDSSRCLRMLHGVAWEEYVDTYGTPDHQALFSGPCVILTSRRTVSAAEDTLAFFRSNHRATIIGEPTCGTTGTPLIQRLSYGSARVCSVGYRLLDGTAFIKKGIQPDILLPVTGKSLVDGKDIQLERALEFLQC